MKREYEFFIRDILQAIDDIENFVEGMSFDDFAKDIKTRSAVIWKIETIGEASKHIPKDIKAGYKELPWQDMAGIRDKIAHFYFGIDYRIVWQVVKKRLPEIKPLIEKMLRDMETRKRS